METGEAAVPPRATSGRRYKALMPWRFQRAFVRNRARSTATAGAAAPRGGGGAPASGSGAKRPKSESVAASGGRSAGDPAFARSKKRITCIETMKRRHGECSVGVGQDSQLKRSTRSATKNSGAEIDCPLRRGTRSGPAKSSHGVQIEKGFGTGDSVVGGDGAACVPEGIQSNVGAENCESKGSKKSRVARNGLKSNVSSGADHVLEQREGKGASTENGVSKESDVAAKRCSSPVPRSNANDPNYRRGQKAIVPWRFQVGYKRSFSKAFCSNGGSLKTTKYRAQGSSTQCTPGTRSIVRCYATPLSNVRVSAVRDFSSGKGEKDIRTSYKKVKVEKDDNQGMPKNGVALARENVIRSLRDFRLIYKNLVNKLEDMQREGGADLQAYKISGRGALHSIMTRVMLAMCLESMSVISFVQGLSFALLVFIAHTV
ncbi:hypothetical protein ZWY2020_057098 [Hordeum vulgare]|nr:hypothetical protein ZWY2020_057098 [Hordeum vulgare]